MGPPLPSRWLLLVASLGLLGCRASATMPDDPLFLTHKPRAAHAVSVPPLAIAHAEPTPPPNPYFADDRPALAGRSPRRGVPGVLTGRPIHEADPEP